MWTLRGTKWRGNPPRYRAIPKDRNVLLEGWRIAGRGVVGEEKRHPRSCVFLGRWREVWRPVWHVSADSGRQSRKAGRLAWIKTDGCDKKKDPSYLPGWFNSPSGLAGAGSSLLPQRPEAVSRNPGRNPRVTVGAQGANGLWESAWRWPTRGPDVPGSYGSHRGFRLRPRRASVFDSEDKPRAARAIISSHSGTIPPRVSTSPSRTVPRSLAGHARSSSATA